MTQLIRFKQKGNNVGRGTRQPGNLAKNGETGDTNRSRQNPEGTRKVSLQLVCSSKQEIHLRNREGHRL
jgi:hypothetical protein